MTSPLHNSILPLQMSLFETPDPVAVHDHALKIYNVSSLPQHSVFRYPGGKTWFAPHLRRWLHSVHPVPRLLIEPFAGGGSMGLAAIFENRVEKVLFVERDAQVAAVWHTLLNDDALWLAERITGFTLSADHVDAVLASSPTQTREIAFQTILKNRINRGGILAVGAGRMKLGEDGKGLASRWYPSTLAKRIRAIYENRHRLAFVEGDGLAIIEQYANTEETIFFIDPPYTIGGKKAGQRLYTWSHIDHDALFGLMQRVRGTFLMTYDNAPEVKRMADHYGLPTVAIPMQNTHHARLTELVVSRSTDWLT